MALGAARKKRLEARGTDLCERVAECLDAFDRVPVFTGPSVFFHVEALRQRRLHASVRTALGDRPLVVSVYATLSSWGMHRLGTRAQN